MAPTFLWERGGKRGEVKNEEKIEGEMKIVQRETFISVDSVKYVCVEFKYVQIEMHEAL